MFKYKFIVDWCAITIRLARRIIKLSIFVCAFAAVSENAPAQDIVVNPAVTGKTLSKNAVRAIFGMRLRNWPDGSPIKVYVLVDESPLHKEFSKRVLNIFPHQLRRSWDRLVYSGTGQAPIELESEEDMRITIASTDGAIGYLHEKAVDKSVRIVSIE